MKLLYRFSSSLCAVLLCTNAYTSLLYGQGYTTHQGLKILNPASPSNIITLTPPSSITSYTLTLPTAAGTNGQVLTTDGSGNLSWTTPSGGGGSLSGSGTATQVAFWSSSSALSSSANLYWDNTNSRLGIGTSSPSKPLDIQASISNSSLMYLRNNSASGYSSIDYFNSSGSMMGNMGYAGASAGNFAGAMYINSSAGTDLAFGGGDAERMRLKSSGALIIGGTSTSGASEGVEIKNNNTAITNSDNTARELRFYEPNSSGTNYSSFKASAQSADISYALPTSAPTTNQYLESDAGGNLSWKYSTKFIRKTSDENVANSTALQDDDELQFTIGANETWELSADLDVYGATGAVKVAVIIPSGTLHVYSFQEANGTEQGEWLTTSGTANVNSIVVVDAKTIVNFKGLIISGGSGGSVKIQWTQQTSSASATTVKANSYLTAKRWQ